MMKDHHGVMAGLAITLFAAGALIAPATTRADLPSYDRVRVLSAPKLIEDAELVDQDGRPFRLASLRGRVALVFFGFTSCPDVCPLAMERLQQIHEAGLLDGDVVVVMISVDGERDTPAVMKTFLARYSPTFLGLTAPPAQVEPIAARFSAVFYKGHVEHGGQYSVAHSPQVFAVDPSGRLRAELYGASNEAVAGITRAMLAEAGGAAAPSRD
jgi:protein SCO1/2